MCIKLRGIEGAGEHNINNTWTNGVVMVKQTSYGVLM